MFRYLAISIAMVVGAEALNSASAEEPTPLVDTLQNNSGAKLRPAISNSKNKGHEQMIYSKLKPCEETPAPDWCKEKEKEKATSK
jgi:hypothetical protein